MSVQTTNTKSNCSKFSLKSDLAGCSTWHFLHFDIIPGVYKKFIRVSTLKKYCLFVHCFIEYKVSYTKEDHRSYIRNFWSCERKAWQKLRLVLDSSPWPLRYRCSALPRESRSLKVIAFVCTQMWQYFLSCFNVYIVSICVFFLRAHLILSLALLCVPHLCLSFLWRTCSNVFLS